jgi:nudix-type nucleoside diphosphatase (YffH/AdpP family)
LENSLLFIYGTLLDDTLRQVVLGRQVTATPAVLEGYTRKTVAGRIFPALVAQKGAKTQGAVLHALGTDDLDAIDYYLDRALFARETLDVTLDGRIIQTEVHLPQDPHLFVDGNWELADHLPLARKVAQHIMRSFEVQSPLNTPLFHHGLDMRARASLRALADSAPVHLRRGFTADDVEVITRRQPYSSYFALEDITLRHKRFDGSISAPVDRSVFLAADAVTVLPYDPVTDQLLLVEQFRPATFVRDDRNPWVLETVAGRCDAGEPVEETARREVMEEAGLQVRSLEKIGSYYSTPGCVTEYIFSFVAIVGLANAHAQTHGLASEGEDILTHILSFEQAMQMFQTGEADCGPLFVSLLWLQSNRTRLRAQFQGA